MSECTCLAVLLGRESVRGSANADSLAAVVRLLTRRPGLGRKCRLRCSKDGIEIRLLRRQEDEGFESDDDAVSQISSDSNSSSCCFVEDHVLKAAPETVATDSANSSGASDNDDADNSLTGSPQPDSKPPGNIKKPPTDDCTREFYVFNDIAFCHTDAAFPKVLVLVIKKKNKAIKGDLESPTGLEAVVFQCKSVEDLREVCASYKEFSRRLKMDLQFRYPHRRKSSTVGSSSSSMYRNVFNDLQRSMSTSPAATNSPFFRTWISQVSSKPQFEKDLESQTHSDVPSGEGNKYNLVQRTDDDGVTHIEVSKAVDGEYVTLTTAADDLSGSSSIISISTPDIGNLLMQTQLQLSSEASPDISEIEGVICADIDSSPMTNGKPYKSITSPSSLIEKDKIPETVIDNPPQRPQRGKYVKKSSVKSADVQQNVTKSNTTKGNDANQSKPMTSDSGKQPGTHERVVRGQFIRVTVEQQQQQTTVRTGHRLFTTDPQALSYPVWSQPSNRRPLRSREDETDYRSRCRARARSNGHHQQRRSRSTGGTSTPPPTLVAVPIPQPTKPLSNRFFGKLKEIASINNAYVGSLNRRRGSSGDLATAQFYHYLEPALKTSSGSSSNLKSVIKKKNYSDHMEPKKVTFSAYATVQVVD